MSLLIPAPTMFLYPSKNMVQVHGDNLTNLFIKEAIIYLKINFYLKISQLISHGLNFDEFLRNVFQIILLYYDLPLDSPTIKVALKYTLLDLTWV